jgi:hypothetical protein
MITINNIEYEINTNVKLGIQRRLREDPENLDNLYEFVMDVLKPSPSIEELEEMGNDDIGDIMEEFEKVQKKKSTDFKKKLSR